MLRIKEKDWDTLNRFFSEFSSVTSEGKMKVAKSRGWIQKNVPNCAICKWECKWVDNNWFSFLLPEYYCCSAQGGKPCLTAYNTEECQNVFERRMS